MKDTRHPHPHVDPRQPRNGARPGTNPPVFVWKPTGGEGGFRLTVARDEGFRDVCLDRPGLPDPVFLPERALPAGEYFWKWSAACGESEVFSFRIGPEAVVLEVPPAREWLERFPAEHPRIYVRPEDVADLRESRAGRRAEMWRALQASADELFAQPHEIDEPPYLADRRRDYRKYFEVWHRAMVESRNFIRGAHTLSLAYLASGDARYARAACGRMASISRWDPTGSSSIDHNDEAHMSVIWHGPQACDWVWDQFTDEQRELVIDQFRRRGQINYEHMHGRGMYGVERFDSHAGREIVFLAMIAFVFHEHIPEAAGWLEWLRPVLCGVWPIWAGDDGAWAEGPSYSTAYVGIMTMFATALKRGAGIDLYRRTFWANHARWREAFIPPYAQWCGFGDNGLRPPLEGSTDIVETIGRETGSGELAEYVAACRRAAPRAAPPAQAYLAPAAGPTPAPAAREGLCRVFPYAGWAAIRTHIDDPARDVALLLRSSPLGAVSHSHASNNDFAIHVAGEVLAMPSGYYDGYGSAHHVRWVWHTKSHNCLTLSGASQLRSHDSAGAVKNAFEDEHLAYFRGTADASYREADRCRRHVCFLKDATAFVLIDEFVAAAAPVGLEWNVHSFNPFAVDERKRAFLIERGASSLEGHFMFHDEAFFSLSEGWDPPPMPSRGLKEYPPQHHLRFNVTALTQRRNLGVVLAPGHGKLSRAEVATEPADGAELARVGNALVLLGQGAPVEYDNIRSDALAVICLDGRTYEITDEGMRVRDK